MEEEKRNIEEIRKWDNVNRLYEKIKYLLYHSYSIERIEMECGIPSYMIIDKLVKLGDGDPIIEERVRQYYSRYQINDNRFIVIADSHIGRIPKKDEDEEDDEYDEDDELSLQYDEYNYPIEINNANTWEFTNAYYYAAKHGIKKIIHLGDLLEGNASEKINHMRHVDKQVEHLKIHLDPKDDIKTYLLYGNHDLHAIEKDHIDRNFYKEFKNFELVGSEIAYMHIGDCFVRLTHLSINEEDVQYQNLKLVHDFELSGHSHIYRIINNKILKVPAIAGIRDNHTEVRSRGFLEAENRDDIIIFKRVFEDRKEEKGIIFDKKEKKLVYES